MPATPTPLLTPLPTFQPVSQTIGVTAPGAPASQANVEITLLSVRPWPGDQYHQPPPGHVFLVVDVELRNQGPASLRTLTSFDFQMINANRAIQYPRLMPPTQDCPLRLVELLPGGWLRACFGYAVLAEGPIEFIVAPAPRRAAGLQAGDYLSFPLRRN